MKIKTSLNARSNRNSAQLILVYEVL